MSAGHLVDKAATKINRAGGALTLMVAKRQLIRPILLTAVTELEESLALLREALKAPTPES